MPPIVLSESEYRDKVHACWLGKNIGGTLGAPVEGRKEIHQLAYFDAVPDGAAPNDDLDFQLVWLKMVQERGPNVRLSDFADYWQKHLAPYPWNEYGFCQRNLARGLRPPVSGCFENYYVDEMGSPIRSEIWACLAPGDPQLAAAIAWKDAVLDHAGGEGVHGEMFWAALESAAFVISDPLALIHIGLQMIPIWSRISRAVREAVWCWENQAPLVDARERILRCFGHYQPCHAPQNHAFTILGWLYGEGYGGKLCAAVNCGYDTDCTGATLGSVLGIVGGTAAIPAEWREPVGDAVVLHKFTRALDAPRTVADLTGQTVEAARSFLAARSATACLGEKKRLPRNVVSLLTRNELALKSLARDVHAGTAPARDGVEITLHYHGEPVLRPGTAKRVSVSVERGDEPLKAKVALSGPGSWRIKEARTFQGRPQFELSAKEVEDRNTISVHASLTSGGLHEAEFVMLGPGEAQGYPCGQNVAGCPKCHARKEACTCQS
jgi:hypothetical protein